MVDPAYPRVDKGHIVPETYQRNFAIKNQVLRHELGSAEVELRNVRSVCRRGPFYRRERRDGTLIDDTEASMAIVEDRAGQVFKQIRDTGKVEHGHKPALAMFFGLQLLRSPTFFDARGSAIAEMLEQTPEDQFKAKAVAEHGIDAVREIVTGHYLSSTHRLVSMLGLSSKATAALVHMHWTVLRFQDPVLVYSDHPVVVWPSMYPFAEGFRGQQFPPVDAIEVRIPLTSKLFLLLTWIDDTPDLGVLDVRRELAGELNQLTIGQAEREWAHTPGTRPPIARNGHEPLAPRLWPTYHADTLGNSIRRHSVQQFLQRHRRKEALTNHDLAEWLREVAGPAAGQRRPPKGRR